MSNHEAKVVRIQEILKHPNADSLGLVEVGGFQVVVRLDQFKIGDLAVYIQPDSIVPQHPVYKFMWDGKEGIDGIVPEKYRRVTVRRFRKEWSEGLLMNLTDYSITANEGDDVADTLGIEHWNPPEDQEDRDPSSKQSKTRPRSLKGRLYFLKNWAIKIITLGQYDPWGELGGSNEKAPKNTPPIYDVENFKHHDLVLEPGETVAASEKIHGSNGRFMFKPQAFGEGKMYAGSRKLWKKAGSTNIWRKVLTTNPDIQKWCVEHPNYVLYGEVVPTQGGFEYGHTKERPHVFFFDVRTPNEEWLNYTDARQITGGYDLEWAPLLHHGPYDLEKIQTLVDGKTKTGGNHIREGIVIRTEPERHHRGLGRVQLKIVSNKYLEKEQ